MDDYILKPFTNQRFHDSLNRALFFVKQQKKQLEQEKLRTLSESLSQKTSDASQLFVSEEQVDRQRLIVKEKGKVSFVPLDDIIWIEAFDYYVKIHVKGHFYTIRESMKKMSDRLPNSQFMRIHKSAIIHTQKLISIESLGQGAYEIKLMDFKLPLKTGRAYKDQIVGLMKDLNM